MPPKVDTRKAIDSVVRLRRAERLADEQTWAEVEPVLAFLEDAVGPTVSRAEAARLLGISYTALDRWIEKGDIAAVTTPRGRREVPLSELVGLLDQIQESERDEEMEDRFRVASAIRRRRRQAEQIDETELLPGRRPKRPRTHRHAELNSLAYHRLVAQRLTPQVVSEARRRLRRWRDAGRIDSRWADEWESLLDLPLPKLAKRISADSPRNRVLRQSSPFAGALTEQERRRLLRAVEQSGLG